MVVVEEVMTEGYEGCEGYEVVKNEREEAKDDDMDSIDFLFYDNNEYEDDNNEALHLPLHHTSHNLDDDVSLSDFSLDEEE